MLRRVEQNVRSNRIHMLRLVHIPQIEVHVSNIAIMEPRLPTTSTGLKVWPDLIASHLVLYADSARSPLVSFLIF